MNVFSRNGECIEECPEVGQFHFRFNAVFAMPANKYALSENNSKEILA